MIFKGFGTLSKETTQKKIVLSPENGFSLKRKILLPEGANSFLSE